jgi:hypothetical protein
MNFRLNDQVKLKIPGGRYLDPEAGEFINLSARVRRVFISGDMAALQFVHLNETQTQNLTKFVTAYAMEQILR